MPKNNSMKIVLLMCLGTFICMIDSTIMNITLPAIQADLNTSLETSSWMLNVYTMTIAVLAIPMARFAEMFGKSKFYIIGIVLFGIGSLLCGLSTSGTLLIEARFLQSIGAAILIPLSMIIGVSSMPVDKRVIPLTLLGASQGLSTALGPTVGGIIAEKISWNWVFYVNIPICVIALIGCLMLLPLKQEKRTKAKIDWFGLMFSVSTIFPINLVLIKGNAWGWASDKSIYCYVISIISIIIFILIEKKVKNPMVNLKLFKDRQFLGSVLIVTFGFVFLIGVMVLLPQFLTRFQGKSELEAALLITPVSASIFIFSQLAGLLVKKIGFSIPVIIGFSIMGIAYYLLHNLSIESKSMEIITLCTMLGIGFSFIISSATIASTSSFEGELLTSSQSVFSMLRQVGVVLAVAIFVGGLTTNIDNSKEKVLHYAKKQVEQLNIQESVKQKIFNQTKSVLQSDGKQSINNQTISEKQHQNIVEQNVKNILDKMPAQKREAARKMVYEKVNQEVIRQETEIQKYSKDILRYAQTEISSSFGSLYKTSMPFVFLCVVLAFVFRKEKVRINTKKSMQEPKVKEMI
jgi:EmrB/QacA subfamily drug resistance transporter